MKPPLRRLALALWLLFSLLGAAQQEAAVAGLRLAHLSPDAPQLDLLIDGELVLRDLAFSEVSRYFYLPAGRHELRVFPHRAPQEPVAEGETAPVEPLEPLVITVEVEAGRYYTVAASGFFNPPATAEASGSLVIEMEPGTSVQVRGPRNYLVSVSEGTTLSGLTAGDYTVVAAREGFLSAEYAVEVQAGSTVTLPINLQEGVDSETPVAPDTSALEVTGSNWYKTQLQLYQDDYERLPPAGQALLRIVHAAPAVSPISVSVRETAAASETEEPDEVDAEEPGRLVVEALGFPNASDYIPLAAGSDTFEIRLAGTDLVLSTLEGLPFESGALYTIYVMGSVSSAALTPLPTVDALIRSTLP